MPSIDSSRAWVSNVPSEEFFLVELLRPGPFPKEENKYCLTGRRGPLFYSMTFLSSKGCHLRLQFANEPIHLADQRYILSQLLLSLKKTLIDAGKGCKLYLQLPQQFGSEALVLAEDLESFFTRTYGYLKAPFACAYWVAAKGIQEKLAELDPYGPFRRRGLSDFRSWVNEEADQLTSLEIGERLRHLAKNHDCSFEELGEKEIEKEKLVLLAAVGQASRRSPPRLYILKNRAAQQKDANPLLLVGKGITFDTGGINLKAFENLVGSMRNDMGGAALMSQLFFALLASGYSEPLALAIPACENLIDGKSMKPGAVYLTRSGLSVVVEHTDAEGRLILADALTYASELLTPKRTLVAATLTTASLRQFTQFDTGAHFFAEADQKDLAGRAARWGEDFVFCRERAAFHEANKSKMADLTNMGRMAATASMGGGSQVAAHFLKKFTKGLFNHLDIFSSTWNWGGIIPAAPTAPRALHLILFFLIYAVKAFDPFF